MHLFYTPDISLNAQQYVLNEQESKHCMRVLRLQVNDVITLMDGRGLWFHAEIQVLHKNQVVVRILEVQKPNAERKFQIHIAIAPTKNMDRLEWFLEKATEIGIDTITPIICERSERKEVKIERLEKVISAAVKQSLKFYHPEIQQAIPFKKFMEQDFSTIDFKCLAHCDEDTEKMLITQIATVNQKYLVLIGPEGDFTPAEIALAKAKGFQMVSLGESRLRTETAALFACFQLNQMHL